MEKRTKNRIARRFFLRFGPEEAVNIGFTGDISLTGIFIKTTAIFSPSTVLKIEIELPGSKILHLRGTVMWAKRISPSLMRHIKKSGMGVKILQPSEEYLQFVSGLKG